MSDRRLTPRARGFCVSTLHAPRPWCHVSALKALRRKLHSADSPVAWDDSILDVLVPARRFFELHNARHEPGAWHRWNE